MSSALVLSKQSRINHRDFDELFRGYNASRLQIKSEMDSSILLTISRVLRLAVDFSNHKKFSWNTTVTSNACSLNRAVVCEYDRLQKQLKSDKKAAELPTHALGKQPGYKAVIDEEEALRRMIVAYTQLAKDISQEERDIQCTQIVMQIATLAGVLYALVDKRMADVTKLCLTDAILNSIKNTTVDLATNEQRSKIMNTLQQSQKFSASVIMELSTQNIYAIKYDGDENIHGYVMIDMPIHIPAGEKREAVVKYIETTACHRRFSLARKLLNAIKFTAKENGYRCLHVMRLRPTQTFWRKCGFECYVNGSGFMQATCNLDPMSLRNILNQ